MTKSIPIKDTGTIKRIKSQYEAGKDYCGLLLFTMAINTGINLKSLLELNVGDVKNKRYMPVGQKRTVFFNEEIKSLIKKVIIGKMDVEPLFVGIKGHRLDRTTVLLRFKDICKKTASGSNITAASWRKTFGYHHYMKYGDLSYLQWYFNQTGIEATMRYIGINENMGLKYRDGISI